MAGADDFDLETVLETALGLAIPETVLETALGLAVPETNDSVEGVAVPPIVMFTLVREVLRSI